MKNLQFWKFVRHELSKNNNLLLIIVVQSKGYTPGKPGFKMAVSANGKIAGTIGGGKVEFDMTEKAKNLLAENKFPPLIDEFSMMNNLTENPEGMICGGIQTMLLFPLTARHSDAVSEILSLFSNHLNGLIQFAPDGQITTDKENSGNITKPEFSFHDENDWLYTEPSGTQPVVHIVGGGHVSLALSQVLSFLDYYVIVYDERKEVDTFVSNSFADEKICIPFDRVHERIEVTEKTHIIIMTPEHKQDETVLRNTLTKNIPYIGMMASLKKRNEIEERLRNEGFDNHHFSRLFSPIGLPIKSSTPAEIAISIAAELILFNSRKV